MSRTTHALQLWAALFAATASRAVAQPEPRPADVDVTEHLGAHLPDLQFVDEAGQEVSLGALFEDARPVLLVIAYYRCPMLCGLVLGNVARTLGALGWAAGDQFRVLTVSFDPEDTPHTAKQRKRAVLAGAPGLPPERWPFWTGAAPEIERLLTTLGVTVRRDARTNQYAHPAVFFALTPDGRISRYIYGFDAAPRDVKLALLEASEGKTGSAFERVLLRCYAYDPATRRYGLIITRLFRGGGAGILAVTVALLAFLFRRERLLERGSTR